MNFIFMKVFNRIRIGIIVMNQSYICSFIMHISWYDKGKERRRLMKLENKEQNIVETESENSH